MRKLRYWATEAFSFALGLLVLGAARQRYLVSLRAVQSSHNVEMMTVSQRENKAIFHEHITNNMLVMAYFLASLIVYPVPGQLGRNFSQRVQVHTRFKKTRCELCLFTFTP